MLPLKEISLMQPPHSEWKLDTCPSLCPAFKGQVEKAENALASFCSDVKIWEQTTCFLLLASVYHCWEKRRAGTELNLDERGGCSAAGHEHCVTEVKTSHTSALGYGKDLISAIPALCSPWSGCCSAAKRRDAFSFTDTDSLRAVNHDLWHVSNQGTCRNVLSPAPLRKRSWDCNAAALTFPRCASCTRDMRR